ncbi:hypothetical protein ACIGT4_00320 [Streptomyces sioyaensis]|uniref:hypothetical protein n=1 Tax=Streptomyces sioyaensis TaxID=67364 RepID=UPI0037D4C2A3
MLEALERTLHQVASLTRSLDRWSGDEDRYRYGSFLECYADFLASVSEITRVLSGLDEDRLHEQAPQLCRLADQAQQCRRRVAEQAERDNNASTHASWAAPGVHAWGRPRSM